MKYANSIFLSIVFLTISIFSNATELVYKWKPGIVYRFQATVLDDVSTTVNMMGVNASDNDIFKTETIFALKVATVQANGTADGILYVEQFKVTNKAGKIIASMTGLPKEALKSAVSVDKKGNFTFKKIVYMIVQETGSNLVVSGKAEKNKVSATATGPDGTQLSVHAEFDPKTGTLKAGYTAQTVGTPKEKKVIVKEDDSKIEIIPYQFLELLKLPDGDLKPGQTANVKIPGTSMNFKVESIIANIATCSNDFKTDMNEVSGKNDNNKTGDKSNNGNMDMNMDNIDMGDMGGMNDMSNQEKAMIPESKSNGKITSIFDTTNGMFKTCKGTVNSSTKSAAVNMNTKSTFTLSGLN